MSVTHQTAAVINKPRYFVQIIEQSLFLKVAKHCVVLRVVYKQTHKRICHLLIVAHVVWCPNIRTLYE